MIVARLTNPDGSDQTLLLVLEPGNIAKLQLGKPITKCLNDFIPGLPSQIDIALAFTPDVEWVKEQFTTAQAGDLVKILTDSLSRPERFPQALDPEALVKVPIPTQGAS